MLIYMTITLQYIMSKDPTKLEHLSSKEVLQKETHLIIKN